MKLMKFTALGVLFSLALSLSGCTKGCSKPEDQPQTQTPQAQQVSPSVAPTEAALPTEASKSNNAISSVDFETDAGGLSKSTAIVKTSKGTVKFKFYSKDAPNTVKRFVELAQSKFYNGVTFHRVVPNFVVQGGDPLSREKNNPGIGTGGSGQKLKAEFNSRKHTRGTVSMARSQDPDSADSQFYFCLGTYPHLDEKYTVFGQVVDFGEKSGDKDVLERIVQGDEIVEITIE